VTEHRGVIRQATAEDARSLAALERAADAAFTTSGFGSPPRSSPGHEAAAAIFLTGEPPAGFAAVTVVDGLAHLEQVSALPAFTRCGLGSALVTAACEWSARQGFPAITLVTYRDVPWNAPFYARRGFVETARTPELAALRASEKARGLDELGIRIAMRRDLAPARDREARS
jgi:GNAT superfamily N-acetyltransferase